MFDIFSYTFFQNAVIGIMLVSIASAIIGTYVVCRRMVFVTGGITHASFGGLGLGFYAGLSPALTAGIFAIASALGVEWLSTRQHVREDSAIGVVWALGMALGTIFIFLTPGYVPELSSFLFGNVLTIGTADLIAFGLAPAFLLWQWQLESLGRFGVVFIAVILGLFCFSTFIGILFYGVLSAGFTSLRMPIHLQWAVMGLIMLFALSLDVLKGKGVKLWKRK